MATSFFQEVYSLVAAIPPGRVATYGQIAMMLGRPRAARMVGWALHQAPAGLPCHRVVSSTGRLAPADLFDGEQRGRLEAEGIGFTAGGLVRLNQHLWQADPDPEAEA